MTTPRKVITLHVFDPAGQHHRLAAQVGGSVMDAAVRHGVPGIVGECGGFLACASCHVHVEPAWLDRVGRAADAGRPAEGDMLDEAQAERLENSRLSCQIDLREELDGLVVRVAPEQF